MKRSARPDAMRTAFLSALLLTCACNSIAAASASASAASSSAFPDALQHDGSSCFQLRLKERNMEQLYETIRRASGLGEGAGEYMTPSAVRALTGRSHHDIRRLKRFAEGLGGSLGQVTELMDSATLCLSAEASQRLLQAHPSPDTPKHRLLLHDPTAPDLDHASKLAASLAQALPLKCADMLHYVAPHLPLSHPARQRKLQGTAGRRDLEQQQGKLNRFEDEELAPNASQSYSTFPLTVDPIPGPASIGPNITLNYGSTRLGTLFVNDDQLALPVFARRSPLVHLGMYNASELMNKYQTFLLLRVFMMPCQWVTEANGTATFISYATEADVANGTCSATLSSNYTASFAAFHGPDSNGTISQPSSEMFSMRCGDAVERSTAAAGTLPHDLCASIGRQVAGAAAANNIGNDTLLFAYNTTAAGLPGLTPLTYVSLAAELQGAGASDPVNLDLGTLLADAVVAVGAPSTPAYLRQLYGVAPPAGGASKGLLAAVTGVSNKPYDYSPADLKIANEALGASVPPVAELLDAYGAFAPNDPTRVYGPNNTDLWQGEAALDIQVLTQFGEGSGVSFGFGASNLTYAGHVYNTPATFSLRPFPDIVSWSYGDDFPYLTASALDMFFKQTYQAVANAVLAKYAAMGVTVLASSGDAGYSGTSSATTCEEAFLSPSFPASSPFVTAVGAVMQSYTKPPSSPADVPELVTCMSAAGGIITSGGGFGSYGDFARPELFSWQQDMVAAYIESQQNSSVWPNTTELLLSGGDYCTEIGCSYGRGYPDLSLVGNLVPVMDSGAPIPAAGTSVTAPVMAGLVAQINAAIRAVPGLEHSRIGFMTPFLYWAAVKYPDAFTDITVGGNNFPTPNKALECPGGYPAAPGWDAATGLGLPNITVLQRAAIDYVITQQKAAKHHRRQRA